MRVLLVRHGDPDYDNDCLTALGKKEAALTAERLMAEPIRAFYVSPLGRARETAEPALLKTGMSATTCEWLREFDAPIHRPDKNGELEITWDWLPKDWTREEEFYSIDTWLDHPLMVETNVAKEYRWVCTGLDALLAEYGYERTGRFYKVNQEYNAAICLVCHFGVSVVILSHLLSISPMLLWHGLAAAPASITEVVTEERRQGIASFRMNRYGDRGHLALAGLADNYAGRFAEVYSDASRRHD